MISHTHSADGGWLSAHPLPADKGSYGNFEALAQQNKQVIQKILEGESSALASSDKDAEILKKLRDFYSSCLSEDILDDIKETPLLHLVRTIRRLYREEDTEITADSFEKLSVKSNGLTAALAFLHSQGSLLPILPFAILTPFARRRCIVLF